MRQATVIVVGAGSRGRGYARFAEQFPERVKVVGVAEPREYYRNKAGDTHSIPADKRFLSWEDVVKVPKFADAVLICTQDNMHEAPAIAFAKMGYHIMLEKPMAPTPEACMNIVRAVKEAGVMFAVCHVLRYTAYTKLIKRLISEDKIGDIVSIQHLEPVKPWHQAHSFVRGNWRNEAESSFMLLQKCCHDCDWLRYIMNKQCVKTQSFGSLKFFNKANQPAGAAERCMDCPAEIESACPYSAMKIYLRDRVAKGHTGWPVDVLTSDVTMAGVAKAIKEGPYGRCVFCCDNDVVDHQVVNIEFADSSSAQMTMTAFCDEFGRQTRIFGTKGCLRGDDSKVWVTDYLSGETTEYDSNVVNDGNILTGHGGGDGGLMDAFVMALQTGDSSHILTGLDDTLESHLLTFAAEKSRKAGGELQKVESLN